jgi:hypothetical protein
MSPQRHRPVLYCSKNPLTRPLPLEPGDYLQKVAEIQARWNALAEEAQQAWPQASLTLVGASTNGNRPFRQERGPEGEKSRAPDDPA